MPGKIFSVHPKINLLKQVVRDMEVRGHLSDPRTVVVFPHRRPVLFFGYYVSQAVEKPVVLPELFSFEDWVSHLYAMVCKDPKPSISELDQAYMAYLSYRKVVDGSVRLDEFFPWAVRIVELFKNFDLELKTPKDLVYPPEGEIGELEARILERLGKIYDAFTGLLEEKGLTTDFRKLRFLAEFSQGSSVYSDGRPVYLVGFYALTGAEDTLFRSLYRDGAYIYWHADPKSLPELYRRWKSSWAVEVHSITPEDDHSTEVFLFEGYDLHSELDELKKRIEERDLPERPDDCCVVLLSTGSLIPTLFHIPKGLPVNVTMGYPFTLTSLYTFLESVFVLVMGKDNKKGYYVKDLLDLIRSPFLEGLGDLERALVEYGSPFVSMDKVIELSGNMGSYMEVLFKEVVLPFEAMETPGELARALEGAVEFVSLQKGFGGHELSFVEVLREGMVFPLKHSLMSDSRMERRGLFRLFQTISSSLRVPFSGEPLRGLQVMGLLETRVLSFDEVFILDANEGVMPAVEEVNPLAPQRLRKALGLPDRYREEVIYRYHFERLVYSSRKAHIFWQFQIVGGGGLGSEGKKTKSRFVERIIWEMEKKKKGFIVEDGRFFKRAKLVISPEALRPPEYLKKDADMVHALKSILARISPSLLNIYMRCPLMFYYSRVLGIKRSELSDDVAFDQLGEAVHEALRNFYREALGNNTSGKVSKTSLRLSRLMELFEDALIGKDFYRMLSDEKRFMLFEGAAFRFGRFIEAQPEETKVLCLEESFEYPFSIPGLGNVVLEGRVDRLDYRGDTYIILDYKTGKVEKPSFRKVCELGDLSCFDYDFEGLGYVVGKLPDIQLPFYMYLFCVSKSREDSGVWDKVTSAYVMLGEDGSERFFPGDKRVEGFGVWLSEDFPRVLRYVVGHMLNSPYWFPATDRRVCRHCQYRWFCRYSV